MIVATPCLQRIREVSLIDAEGCVMRDIRSTRAAVRVPARGLSPAHSLDNPAALWYAGS